MKQEVSHADLASSIGQLSDQLKDFARAVEERLFNLEVAQRETNQHLDRVEGEQIATRADIKELYILAS
jgi:predicted component of type VI protein secretion system